MRKTTVTIAMVMLTMVLMPVLIMAITTSPSEAQKHTFAKSESRLPCNNKALYGHGHITGLLPCQCRK